MQKYLLSKEEAYEIVQANKYEVGDNRLVSRCIDGRYADSHKLAPLGLAGADVGELALIQAAGNTYGFEVNAKKAYEVLTHVVGGVKNIQMHTDTHADKRVPAGGCGHFTQMKLDPGAYHLTPEDVLKISEIAQDAKKKGAVENVLQGDHLEGAVVQVKGPFSVKTRYFLETGAGTREVEVFVFHESLVNNRHRILAEKLIEKKAVTLMTGQDAEYLYEVLSETTEDHLMETARRLAKGLPIYLINFQKDGSFDLKELGTI